MWSLTIQTAVCVKDLTCTSMSIQDSNGIRGDQTLALPQYLKGLVETCLKKQLMWRYKSAVLMTSLCLVCFNNITD